MKRKIAINDDRHKNVKSKSDVDLSFLPPDVLILIFKLFTPSERRNLLLVCKNWFIIGTDHFSSDSCITLTDMLDYSRNAALYQTFSTTRICKNKREFHLIVDSIPNDLINRNKFFLFIGLISPKIKNVKIGNPNCNFARNITERVYKDMINLEILTIVNLNPFEYAFIFGPWKIPKKLHTVNMKGRINILGLQNIKNRVLVQHFTCETFDVPAIGWLTDYATFMSQELKDLLRDVMLAISKVRIKTDFNFCAENQMTIDDVTGLEFSDYAIATLTPIMNLENLKDLEFYLGYAESLDLEELLGTEPFINNNITSLKVKTDHGDNVYPDFNIILRSFPNIEKLEIHQVTLDAGNFTFICEHFPKLKVLVLLDFANEFSNENVFGQDESSFTLKNLKHLEKLVLQCEIDIHPGVKWPSLPSLTELSLSGSCFSKLSKIMYKSLAIGSPNITNFRLKSTNTSNDAISPLLFALGQNLRDLFVTGDGICMQLPNNQLLRNITKHCKNLSTLSIHDNIPFTMIQEARLFTKIPSLKVIKYNSTDDLNTKSTTRTSFLTIQPYLKPNI